VKPAAVQIPTANKKIRKGNGGREANLVSLQIRRGSVSSPLLRRYDAMPMEEAMIAISAVSKGGDTGASTVSAYVLSARNRMNPTLASAIKKPESRK
jgi:hypothetical protein